MPSPEQTVTCPCRPVDRAAITDSAQVDLVRVVRPAPLPLAPVALAAVFLPVRALREAEGGAAEAAALAKAAVPSGRVAAPAMVASTTAVVLPACAWPTGAPVLRSPARAATESVEAAAAQVNPVAGPGRPRAAPSVLHPAPGVCRVSVPYAGTSPARPAVPARRRRPGRCRTPASTAGSCAARLPGFVRSVDKPAPPVVRATDATAAVVVTVAHVWPRQACAQARAQARAAQLRPVAERARPAIVLDVGPRVSPAVAACAKKAWCAPAAEPVHRAGRGILFAVRAVTNPTAVPRASSAR